MPRADKTAIAKAACALIGTWSALCTPLALAQQTPPAQPAADKSQLMVITVTANRRVEDQQKVSVSVTGLSEERLAERNILDLSMLEGLSPGLTMGKSGVDPRPAMRGVRTENVGVNGDTTIGFFVDGVYRSRTQQALASFVDVERVEIQRGPQGTLFGRNTFGGNIVVSTKAPEMNRFDIGGSLMLGSFNKRRAEGILNIPVADGVAVRLVAAIDKTDPMIKSDFNPDAGLLDQDLKYVRGSIKIKPNKDFDAVLRVDRTTQGGAGASAFGAKQAGTYIDRASCQPLFNAEFVQFNVRGTGAAVPQAGNRDGVPDCTRTVGAGAGNTTGLNGLAVGSPVDIGIPIYKPNDAYRIDNDLVTRLTQTTTNGTAELSYKFAAFSVRSISGYTDFNLRRTGDSDFSSSSIAVDSQNTTAKTFSQEFQLLSEGSGPLSYIAGYYFFKDKLKGTFINEQFATRTIRSPAIAAPIVLGQNGGGAYNNELPETVSNAIYGQLSYKLTEQIRATGGLRYTVDRKSYRFANANSLVANGTLIQVTMPDPPESAYGAAGTTNCVGSNAVPGFNCDAGTNRLLGATYNDAEFKKTTGRLAVEYALTSQQLLYASVSNGFRSGGFNSGQVLDAFRSFKPESVTALEFGSKNRFLGNTLQLNATVYSNRYVDLQEQQQIAVGATTISTIFNAAKAQAKGLEVEAEWRASAQFNVGGTLSLMDAKYTDFRNAPLPFGTSILVTDAAVTAPTVVNGVTIAPAGQRRVFAPGYDCGLASGTGGAGQPAAAFTCNLTGKRIPFSPRMQLSVFTSYEIGLGNLGSITPMLVATYSSGFFGLPLNAESDRQKAYAKADLKLNWQINESSSLLAFVDNVTDKESLSRFVWGANALQTSPSSPRTFGIRYAYKTF